MATQSIKRTAPALALGLAVLAFSAPADAKGKHPVTRPCFSKGHVVVFVDLTTFRGDGTWDDPSTWNGPPIFPFVATNSGTATHLGAYDAITGAPPTT